MSKTRSKTIFGFDPRSIPGCQLWLDASDMSTTSNISTSWLDKSGYNRNAIGSGSPSINTTAINGYPAVNFNGSSYFTGAITNTAATLSVFFVAIETSGIPAGAGIVGFGRSGYADWNDIGSMIIGNNNGTSLMSITRDGVNYQSFSPVFGIPFLFSMVLDGTKQNAFLDGSILTPSNNSATGAFAYTNYAIGTRAGNTGNNIMRGFIGEVIIYSGGLSKQDRYQTEGYLTWKWGMNTQIPIVHPHYSLKPFIRQFSPLDVDGCKFWLDGADTSSMTLSGTNVIAWNDKIQNIALNVLNSGQYPVFQEKNGLYFNNPSSNMSPSSQGLFSTTQWILPTQKFTFFCASYPISSDGYRNSCFFGTDSYTTPPNVIMSIEMGTSNNLILMDYNGSNWGQNITATPNATMQRRVDALVSTPGATSGWNFTNGIEGSYSTTNSYTSTQTNYPINVSYVGAYTPSVQGHRNFNGSIYEIIIYSTALSAEDRQRVEGYLANKWNFKTNLNSIHPFYKIPPSSVVPFLPINISGLLLWLDVADSSSMTFSSGTNISVWNDKSGNGNNATAAGTVPTFSNNAVNFGGAGYFTTAVSAALSNESVFFVAKYSSSGNGTQGILGQTTNGGRFIGGYPGTSSIIASSYNLAFGSVGPNNGAPTNTTFLGEAITTDGSQIVYTNGGNSGTIVSLPYTAGAMTVLGTGFNAGSPNSSQFLLGSMNEVLIFNTPLTIDQRQQIEGYLAWKWGINNLLPSTHFYYKFAPSVKIPIPIVPSGGVGTILNFTYTGSDQTWTCPSGTSSIRVSINGAGGGNGYGSIGGSGGLVEGSLAVTSGNVYTIIVGQGGATGGNTTYGGGGYSGAYGYGSQGGGRSAIAYGVDDLVTAGAGGGSAYYANGGVGGGIDGGIGYGNGFSNSTGGTQYSGGIGSTSYGAYYYDGTNGGKYYGGNGGWYYGSGGGGGWYGGGGGGYYAQPGAGGSSYVGNLYGSVVDVQSAGSGAGLNGSVSITLL